MLKYSPNYLHIKIYCRIFAADKTNNSINNLK